jgi:hypothetical protein
LALLQDFLRIEGDISGKNGFGKLLIARDTVLESLEKKNKEGMYVFPSKMLYS